MRIIQYDKTLKSRARSLRRRMTVQERLVWTYIRNKQILDVQFYRQKTINRYIVDFYAPSVKLVIEIDGSQHSEPEMLERDQRRDAYLQSLGLHVLRFENGVVEQGLDLLLIDIERYIFEYRK